MNEAIGGRSYHKIHSLTVTGGFLDGFEEAFDPHLSCIIGGRGTGKTTVLEILRFALGAMPDPRRATAQSRQIEKLIAGNLGTGRVRVRIETRDGLIYHVERSVNEPPEILDEEMAATSLSLEHGSIFDVEVYSQDEIENIANSPSFQLDLIDKFIEPEIRTLNQQIVAKTREIRGNGSDLVRLTGEVDELTEGLTELAVIAEKLKAFTAEGGEGAEALNHEVAMKGLRDRETRVIQGVVGFLSSGRQSIEELAQSIQYKGGRVIPAEAIDGPNVELSQRVATSLEECMEEIGRLLAAAIESIDRCSRECEEASEHLREQHLVQEQRFREVVEKHEQEEGKARERTQLQRRQNELQEQQRELEAKKAEFRGKQEERRALMRGLSDLRDRRTELREGVAKSLNEQLSPEIRVSITQFGDTSEYRGLLTDAFKGTGIHYNRITGVIVTSLPPHDFARIVQTNGVQDLIEHLDLPAERAGWIVQQLRNTQAIHDIEAVEMRDVPRIELQDGPEYKDSSNLSTGQKCTTILPILLLESEKPLLIDQPEDNLDNAFIYKTVVRRIREVKQTRQLIFVTHNPNIPVLGDAGRVLVMTSTGRRASAEASGSVDEVKEHVEAILEGGKEAFVERQKRYGY